MLSPVGHDLLSKILRRLNLACFVSHLISHDKINGLAAMNLCSLRLNPDRMLIYSASSATLRLYSHQLAASKINPTTLSTPSVLLYRNSLFPAQTQLSHLALLFGKHSRRRDVGDSRLQFVFPPAYYIAVAAHHRVEAGLGDIRRVILLD